MGVLPVYSAIARMDIPAKVWAEAGDLHAAASPRNHAFILIDRVKRKSKNTLKFFKQKPLVIATVVTYKNWLCYTAVSEVR
jgi:hypothetical protein